MKKLIKVKKFKPGHTYKVVLNKYDHELPIGTEFTAFAARKTLLSKGNSRFYNHIGEDLGNGAPENMLDISEVKEVIDTVNVKKQNELKKSLLKIIEDTFNEEIHATVGNYFGSPSAHIEGKEAFLKSLADKLKS